MPGPLAGFRVIEMAGLGPVPFGGMLLADLGADVVRVDRVEAVNGEGPMPPPCDVMQRGKRSVAVDLKHPDGAEVVIRLAQSADAFLEGFRPGVVERLGIGPEPCQAGNPRLVYARMTGWGQDGPYAPMAGHDINYVALSGTLSAIGRKDRPPVPPLSLAGDFGGGGMLLACGVLAAILEAQRSGEGQVIDCAMVDGAALLAAFFHGFRAAGHWSDERESNIVDGGAWFYDVYETADGEYVSFGALEPQFYAELLRLTGFGGSGSEPLPPQMDRTSWPAVKERFATVVRTKTRAEWCEILDGTDCCFAPVLGMDEAPRHPHNAARNAFIEVAGVPQPAPAPRFSRTATTAPLPPPPPGFHTVEVLGSYGFSETEIRQLRNARVVKPPA
jgi:alpha-methylacyl-CoA racemase